MEFKTDSWGGVRLVIPDEPNVLQLVKYDSIRYEIDDSNAILGLWEMAQPLIVEWECEALPEIDTNLAEVTDPRVARIIEWVAATVSAYRRSLDAMPKN